MPAAVKIRSDYSSEELRRLARRSKDANQSRRLLSLAAVLDGMSRALPHHRIVDLRFRLGHVG